VRLFAALLGAFTLGAAQPISPLAHWSFETGLDGRCIPDVTGNGYDLCIVQNRRAFSLVDWNGGKALWIADANHAVVVADSRDAFGCDRFTIEAIIRISRSTQFQQCILSTNWAYPGLAKGFDFHYGAKYGDIELSVGNGSNWVHCKSPAGSLRPDTLYHVAATFDGVELAVYIDGRQQRRTAFRPGRKYAKSSRLATVGYVPNADLKEPRSFYTGGIDELRFYAAALDSQDIGKRYRTLAETLRTFNEH
jgi:hypothetical protein